MAYVNGNQATPDASSSTTITSAALNVTAGNTLVVFVQNGSGGAPTSVADSAGNTYAAATSTQTDSTGTQTRAFYAYNVAGGANGASVTVTATFASAATYRGLVVEQYSGFVSGNPLDTAVASTSSSSTPIISSPFSTTTTNSVVVAFAAGSPPFTAGSGYTIRHSGNYTGSEDQAFSSQQSGTTASMSAGSNSASAIHVLAFKSTAAPSTTRIAPNNAGIVYSPGNWTGASATSNTTINAGAYFKVLLAGLTAASLTFDVSSLGAPASQIYYRFNGYEAQSPWIKAAVASSVALTLPPDMASAPYQFLEVVVKSTSETITRWSSTSATAVVFTGVTANSGTTASAPATYPRDVLFFGDSITEGVRTVNQTATNDTDRNDALMGWALAVGERMGCEIGAIGFGAQGWTTSGSGGVPALPSAYNLVMPGVSRTFPAGREPVAVIVNMGTNDQGASDASVTAAVQSFLNGALSLYPTASIVLLRPFGGYKASAIQAGIAAVGSGRVFYEDTTGMFDTSFGSDTINVHPNGVNNLARIAPALAAKLVKYGQPRRFTVVAA